MYMCTNTKQTHVSSLPPSLPPSVHSIPDILGKGRNPPTHFSSSPPSPLFLSLSFYRAPILKSFIHINLSLTLSICVHLSSDRSIDLPTNNIRSVSDPLIV